MKRLFSIIFLALSLIVVSVPHPAHAATTFSIESVDLGLGQADLKETTLNVIRLVLSLLTLVAVVMIIASVFVAATAGDSDRADAAKRTLTGAVIGLIIVLLAWAIVLFVARTTSNVTSNS